MQRSTWRSAFENIHPQGDEKLREKVQARLAIAKRDLGTLWVRVNVERADVIVDGVSVGTAPLPGEIFVEPGTRMVEAKSTGYVPTRVATLVQKGGEASVELVLAPEAKTAPSGALAASSDNTIAPSASPTRTIGWIGVAVTGGALATATGFWLAAHAKSNEIRADQRDADSASCAVTPSQRCADLHDAVNAHDAYSNIATASLIAAGVLGTATVAFFCVVIGRASDVLCGPPLRGYARRGRRVDRQLLESTGRMSMLAMTGRSGRSLRTFGQLHAYRLVDRCCDVLLERGGKVRANADL